MLGEPSASMPYSNYKEVRILIWWNKTKNKGVCYDLWFKWDVLLVDFKLFD